MKLPKACCERFLKVETTDLQVTSFKVFVVRVQLRGYSFLACCLHCLQFHFEHIFQDFVCTYLTQERRCIAKQTPTLQV